MMKREDFSKVSGFLCESLDHLEDSGLLEHNSHLRLAKSTLEQAIQWLDRQQFHKGRGIPFSIGEDSRRKDRLKGAAQS